MIFRRLLTAALLFGVFAGFGSMFHQHFEHRHELFEEHLAALCANAALRGAGKTPAPAHAP